jgi:membrane protease YdiL (CAAX protease family)
VLPLADGIESVPPVRLAFLALAAFLVALNEELLYRGLLLRALLPWGVARAVAILAVLFSLIHLPNLLVGGSLGFELVRLGITSGGAVGLMAVRLRTSTLSPLILAHWGLDIAEYAAAGGIPALGAVHQIHPTTVAALFVYNVIFGLAGIYVLRQHATSSMHGQMRPMRVLGN